MHRLIRHLAYFLKDPMGTLAETLEFSLFLKIQLLFSYLSDSYLCINYLHIICRHAVGNLIRKLAFLIDFIALAYRISANR